MFCTKHVSMCANVRLYIVHIYLYILMYIVYICFVIPENVLGFTYVQMLFISCAQFFFFFYYCYLIFCCCCYFVCTKKKCATVIRKDDQLFNLSEQLRKKIEEETKLIRENRRKFSNTLYMFSQLCSYICLVFIAMLLLFLTFFFHFILSKALAALSHIRLSIYS